MSPVIFGNVDVAMLCFYAFFLFFLGLVVYLNRESRREGYPLEDEMTGRVDSPKWIDTGAPKQFLLPHGQGVAYAPPPGRDPIAIKARKAWGAHGAPWVPTGDPLADGIGPAAWAERAHRPDLTAHGLPRIVPLRVEHELSVVKRDADPRGFTVLGVDGKVAGTVTELWVDRVDRLIRYLETRLPSGRTVLLPMNMALVKGRKGVVTTDSLAAHQFEGAPGVASPDTITLNEEERIMAYFGGGYLYATPDRAEPLM
ncbi:MAG: photosynthetic reaction center subunit H [Sphingomonadaceae bacterium]